MKKLLILSSDTGEGHNSAAAAIHTAAEKAGLRPSIRRPLEESGRLNRAFGGFYNTLLTRKPQWMTHYLWVINHLRPNARDFLYRRPVKRFIGSFIDSEKPDVILSVHPMLNHFIPRFIREERLGIPFNVFMTDPFPPFWRGWSSPGIDRYFVVRKEAADALKGMGVEENRIELVPMPMRSPFKPATSSEVERFRQEHELDGNGIIFINGGARGGGAIFRIYEAVRKVAGGANIIVSCGRNATLRAELERIGDAKTRIFGFITDIHRYIAASDLVLTKPGAMSTYETLACGVPPVLLGILALMPQESGMFRAAARYNFGFAASTFADLENIIRLGPREWKIKRDAIPAFYQASFGDELIERISSAHARA